MGAAPPGGRALMGCCQTLEEGSQSLDPSRVTLGILPSPYPPLGLRTTTRLWSPLGKSCTPACAGSRGWDLGVGDLLGALGSCPELGGRRAG